MSEREKDKPMPNDVPARIQWELAKHGFDVPRDVCERIAERVASSWPRVPGK